MFEAIRTYYKNLVPGITNEDLNALEAALVVKEIKKGEYLVKEGHVCRNVSFVNYGLLRIYYQVDGKDFSIGFVSKGDYTSEYESFLTRAPAAQNIEALADSQVVDLNYDSMQQLYKSHPVFQEFGRKIAEFLFIMLNRRNTALLVLSPEERYRQMIENNPSLMQQVPQYMLASYIGVTPEHLSRIRRKMTDTR